MSSSSQWASDKARLQEILSRDEFVDLEKADGPGLLERVLNVVLDAIADMFAGTEIPDGAASAISTGLVVATVIGLLVLIFWLSKKVIWKPARKRMPLVGEEAMRGSVEYLQEAKRLGEAGEWREAVRYLFLALLFSMQEKSWIRVEPWKTNWEYAAELQYNYPQAVDMFRRHARLFEKVWYGQGQREDQLFWAHVQELEESWREEGRHG